MTLKTVTNTRYCKGKRRLLLVTDDDGMSKAYGDHCLAGLADGAHEADQGDDGKDDADDDEANGDVVRGDEAGDALVDGIRAKGKQQEARKLRGWVSDIGRLHSALRTRKITLMTSM